MIFIMLLLVSGVHADVVRDVNVEFLVDNPLVEKEYADVWQINNLDHISGKTDSLEVFVEWFFNDLNGNYTRSLNRFTRSGGPSLNITNGSELCVNVTPINFFDPNLSNNYVCKSFSTDITFEEKEEDKSFCGCDFFIYVDDANKRQGETFRYGFEFCSSPYPLAVSYWIEDVRGSIVRNIVNTTSSSLKSFTPSFSELEKSFIINAMVEECNLLDRLVISSYKNLPSPFLDVRIPSTANFGSVFNVEVTGIKDSSKRVLDIYVEKDGVKFSEVSKVYVDDFSFSFVIPVVLFDKDSSYNDMYMLVVSGLDFYHEERIYLIGEDKELEVFELLPKFNSFYTRKQLFDGSLTIQYSVDNVFSGELLVITSKGTYSEIVTSRTGSLDVEVGFPNEVVLGLLHDSSGVLVDQRFIQLNLSLRTEEELVFENPIVINAEPEVGRFRQILSKIFRI